MRAFLLALLCLLPAVWPAAAEPPPFAVADGPVPVFDRPDLGRQPGGDGRSLAFDRCGQLRSLEFVALPGTPFVVEEERSIGGVAVYRVTTPDYPYPVTGGLWVDARLVVGSEQSVLPRSRQLPSRAELLARLRAAAGTPYVWGGNLRSGVPRLAELYPLPAVAAGQRGRWTLAGLDCSGLLYEATGGWTPRNTSSLVGYGVPVPAAGLDAAALAARLRPLDLLVWNGHVLIVLDRGEVIESRLRCGAPGAGGVEVRPLKERLRELLRERQPADVWPAGGGRLFVVRRWYPLP